MRTETVKASPAPWSLTSSFNKVKMKKRYADLQSICAICYVLSE